MLHLSHRHFKISPFHLSLSETPVHLRASLFESPMSNSDEQSFNDALLNNNIPMEAAEPGKVAVAADIRDETLIQMMLNGDFKFEGESKSLPSSSSMFPCLDSSSSPAIHLSTTTTTPDLDHKKKVHKLNDDDDDDGFQTPSQAIVSIETTSPESSQLRKRRRRRLDLVVSDDHEKRPDWLPLDWQIEYRRREGGATAGLTDRYYYEPGSRRQFRSKKEVLCYLETGTRRKYKGKSQERINTAAANVTPSVSIKPSEQNGSSSETRKRSDLNFDFDNPPKKVTWVLNSFPEAPGSWTSFISGEMVPGHTRQEWDAAFTYHVHGVVTSSSKVDEVRSES